MGSGGGLSFASGLAQGIAKAQDQKEQKEYANLLKKKMQLDVDLEMQKQQIIKSNPELAMVAMGLAKPQDPTDQAVLKMIMGGMGGGVGQGIAQEFPKPWTPPGGRDIVTPQESERMMRESGPTMLPRQQSLVDTVARGQVGAQLPQSPAGGLSRDFNVGNIRSGPTSFASYASPEEGVAASADLLRRNYRGRTLEQIIQKWAPPSENYTDAYVKNLSQITGIPANQVPNLDDPATLQNLIWGMSIIEKGPTKAKLFTPDNFTNGVQMAMSGQFKPGSQFNVQVRPASYTQTQQAQAPQQGGGLGLDPKQFALGYLNKKYGYPMDEFTWRTVAGPGGMPYSVPFDKRTNRPMWEAAVPEPVKGEYQDVAGPDRRPQKQAFNPYNQQPIGEPINQPYKVSPQKISMPGGGEAIIPLDEYAWPKKTEQPAGQPGLPPDAIQTAPPKGETSTEAGKIQLAQTGLEALREFRGMIFDTDGKLNKTNLFNASVGTPWSNGRRLEQLAQNAIDAVIRAATGAGLNNQELTNYTKRYVPSVFDDEKTVRAKVQQLDSFLNGYLEKMDPAGTQRLRTGLPGPAAMKQIKTAEEFLKMKGGQ